MRSLSRATPGIAVVALSQNRSARRKACMAKAAGPCCQPGSMKRRSPGAGTSVSVGRPKTWRVRAAQSAPSWWPRASRRPGWPERCMAQSATASATEAGERPPLKRACMACNVRSKSRRSESSVTLRAPGSGEQMLAAIDGNDGAGEHFRGIRDEEGGEAAALLDGGEAAGWGLADGGGQQIVEMRDAAGGAGGDGPGRDGVHADILGPEFGGGIAHRAFERRLDRAHEVIIRHDALGAEIADSQQAASFRHERRGEMRGAEKGVAGNIHGEGKAGRGTVHHAATQILGRGEGDVMEQEIEPAPALLDFGKYSFQRARLMHIAGEQDVAWQAIGDRLHIGAGLAVEIGGGERGAAGGEG